MAERARNWKQAAAAGRRWDESDGRSAVAAWQRSGESASAFARRHGIGAHRLWWWQKRLGEGGGAAGVGVDRKAQEVSALAPLLPVTVRGSAQSGAVSVVVDGVCVQVAEPQAVSPAWVGALVAVLREQDR